MPRETITNRAVHVLRSPRQRRTVLQLDENGRSLAADRRTTAKTVAKKGDGDRGDQKVSRTTITSKQRAPAKQK